MGVSHIPPQQLVNCLTFAVISKVLMGILKIPSHWSVVFGLHNFLTFAATLTIPQFSVLCNHQNLLMILMFLRVLKISLAVVAILMVLMILMFLKVLKNFYDCSCLAFVAILMVLTRVLKIR